MPTCKSPIFVKSVGGLTNCGQCLPCRLSKRSKWTFRIVLESLLHKQVLWCTLTYAQENEPRSYVDKDTGQIYEAPPGVRGTLSPDDLELFLKRLRKKLPPKFLRYFAVGEYGSKSSQPHYHLFLFSFPPEMFHLVREAWCNPKTKEPIGMVRLDCADVHADGGLRHVAQYTARYTVKKMTTQLDKILEGRYKEFQSHSLGIGSGSVDRLIDALGGISALKYVQTYKDIPRVVKFNGHTYVIDRYLRHKILERLPYGEKVKEAQQAFYKEEMRSLLQAAYDDPAFLEEARKIYGSHPTQPELMILMHKKQNAQKVLNTETKHRLYQKKENL